MSATFCWPGSTNLPSCQLAGFALAPITGVCWAIIAPGEVSVPPSGEESWAYMGRAMLRTFGSLYASMAFCKPPSSPPSPEAIPPRSVLALSNPDNLSAAPLAPLHPDSAPSFNLLVPRPVNSPPSIPFINPFFLEPLPNKPIIPPTPAPNAGLIAPAAVDKSPPKPYPGITPPWLKRRPGTESRVGSISLKSLP